MQHSAYAKSPEHYVRAFLLLQEDLKQVFEFLEPADQNLQSYSFRIHGLLIRACVEAEANLKAILSENGFTAIPEESWNITTFFKVNASHHLSSFEVQLPVWTGGGATRRPFAAWAGQTTWTRALKPAWYDAYNKAKHDRHNEFARATLENLIDAVCACLVLLSSQFIQNDFQPGGVMFAADTRNGFEGAIGDYFGVKFPSDWSNNEQYGFSYEAWQAIAQTSDPFQKYPY